MARNYEVRTARNEASLEQAGRHQDPWTDDDVATLRDSFGTVDHVELAARLGRTVESVRQKFYSGTGTGTGTDTGTGAGRGGGKPSRTPGQRAWEKGVISFGKDYW